MKETAGIVASLAKWGLRLPVDHMEEFCALKEKVYNILAEIYRSEYLINMGWLARVFLKVYLVIREIEKNGISSYGTGG